VAASMASAMPNLDGVRDALAAFRAALQCAARTPDVLGSRPTAELHAQCAWLVNDVAALRDEALALARSAGATWERLEIESGVADSTLRDRLTRWEAAAR
jgi:hypothetical protein